MKKIVLALIIFSVAFSSCKYLGGERVVGNGRIASQARNVSSFNSVDVSGSVMVHIRQDMNQGVKIETDENLLEYLDVYNDGATLVIRTKKGYNLDPSKDIIAYVSAPTFNSIEVSGACDIIGDTPLLGSSELTMRVSGSGDIQMQVNLPKVTTSISGSGSVNLKGQAPEFSASVSGSGSVKCMELITENTTLDLSGSADAEITANKQLNVEASGASSVQYKGNAQVSQHISGAGSVKKVG